jgi:hypothetical protein
MVGGEWWDKFERPTRDRWLMTRVRITPLEPTRVTSFLLPISMSSDTPDHLDPAKWADMLGPVF